MLSKNRIKFFSSLALKKFRESNGFFMAEGEKIVREILLSGNSLLEPAELLACDEFLSAIPEDYLKHDLKITPVSEIELKKISALSAPNKAALLVKMPSYIASPENIVNSLSLVLEDIRDPGNLGTIIRTADWFGIKDIFCSRESVDAFNPKTVQSTMGAIARVRIHYVDLLELISYYKEKYGMGIIGTMLNGEDIRNSEIQENAMIIFGNESRGISEDIEKLLTGKVKIPAFNNGEEGSESLNVASAVAIVCWETRRGKEAYSK